MAWTYRVTSGLVDTSDSFSDEMVIDMSNEIADLDVDEAQFTTMLMKLPSTPARAVKVNWLEDSFLPNYTTVATSATSIATNIAVASSTGNYFVAGDVVRNVTKGDAMIVTATYTSSIDVTRAQGSATASAAATGDVLLIVGQASAQGSDLPSARQTLKQSNYNYCQLLRRHVQWTNTNLAVDHYGPDLVAREKGKALVEHKRQIEQTFFFGARNLITTGSEPQGLCGGLYDFVTSNVTNVGGTLAATALDSALETIYAHGSKNKAMFVGPKARRAISNFLRDAWQPNSVGDKKYGAVVDGYIVSAYGTDVPVFVKRNWNDIGHAGTIFVVDLEYVRARPLRPTKYVPLDFERLSGADKFSFEYKTETSLQVGQESVHGRLYGITG